MSVKNRAAKVKRHTRTCSTKHGHETRQKAHDALAALAKNLGANPAKFDVYRCLNCRLWHYGHRPR